MVVAFAGSNATDVIQPSRGRVTSHSVDAVADSAARDDTTSPLLVPAPTRFGFVGEIAIVLTRPPSGIAVLTFVHSAAPSDVRYKYSPPSHNRFGSDGSITNGETNR